ncbi:glycoside hydrolase [Caulochytrium protostelioides]|uniref:mannan endo-1,4-beta-mannosidase n=1 Tax=Caulochytrium protostelioides TaxID=1555241 RepID=A0A4P9WTT5_9FUNG|nr:glycoside hydrolase [Caulochytrium protostelioides]
MSRFLVILATLAALACFVLPSSASPVVASSIRTSSTHASSAPASTTDTVADDDLSGLSSKASVRVAKTVPLIRQPLYCPTGACTALMRHITNKDGVLMEGDVPFQFVSVNVPNLLMIEDRPGMVGTWVLPTRYEVRDAIKTVSGLGGKVIRTFTLGFGEGQHVTGPTTFNGTALGALDYALFFARMYNVRLILPLVNNAGQAYGGWDQYVRMFGSNLPKEAFFTDDNIVTGFKSLITTLLERVNPLTHIKYRDDPALMAIEIGNELGGWDESTPPVAWTRQIAEHIKKVSGNQKLVINGVMGGTNSAQRWGWGKDQGENAKVDTLCDIYTNHYYYGEADVARMREDIELAASHKKNLLIGEFGFMSHTVMKSLLDVMKTHKQKKYVSGMLLWSLRFRAREGGFYKHNEDHGYMSYHLPGWPADKEQGFNDDELDVTKFLIDAAHEFSPERRGKFPLPDAPELRLLPGNKLTWRGSAWAVRYEIYRTTDVNVITASQDIKSEAAELSAAWEKMADLKDNRSAGSIDIPNIRPVGVVSYRMRAIATDNATPSAWSDQITVRYN